MALRARLCDMEPRLADTGRIVLVGSRSARDGVRATWESLDLDRPGGRARRAHDLDPAPSGKARRTFDPITVEITGSTP
jgi:hypothetical protein